MLPIRCALLESGTLGGHLRFDEKSCLQYLSELYHYLVTHEEAVYARSISESETVPNHKELFHEETSQKDTCFSLLCITKDQWMNFGLDICNLFAENEIEALWSMFATIVISEGLAIRCESASKKLQTLTPVLVKRVKDYNSLDEFHLDPRTVAIDFRQFGLLLLLQIKKATVSCRNQLFHRLLRASNNEVVYSNPAAAAAAYQHAAQITGGLVSPRSSPRVPSFNPGNLHPSSLPLTSVSALISPRGATHPCSTTQSNSCAPTPADDIKQFILSNFHNILRIIHCHFTENLKIINRYALDALTIYIDLPKRSVISVLTESFEGGSRLKSPLSPTEIEKRISKYLIVDQTKYPILCRPISISTLSGLLASTAANPNSMAPACFLGRKDSYSSSTGPSANIEGQSFISNSCRDLMSSSSWNSPITSSFTTVIIEGQKSNTIFESDDCEMSLTIRNSRKNSTSAVVLHKKMSSENHIDRGDKLNDGISDLELDSGHRSSSLPTRAELRSRRNATERSEFDRRSFRVKKDNKLQKSVPNLYLSDLVDCTIYILKAVRYVAIQNCKDCRITVPAIASVASLRGCSNTEIHATARCFRIDNCYEMTLNIFSLTPPILLGDTRGVKVGPYNVLYSRQKQLMESVGLQFHPLFIARWATPTLISRNTRSATTTHTSTNAGVQPVRTSSSSSLTREPLATTISVSSVESIHSSPNRNHITTSNTNRSQSFLSASMWANSLGRSSISPSSDETSNLGMYSLIAPEEFKTVTIPEISKSKSSIQATELTLMLPQIYAEAFKVKQQKALEMMKTIQQVTSSSSEPLNVAQALHSHFLNWLQQSGHVKELTELSKADVSLICKGSSQHNSAKCKQQPHSSIHSSPLNSVGNSKVASTSVSSALSKTNVNR